MFNCPARNMMNKKPNLANPFISKLPSHILYDIFCLMPTKSILTCKLVCKPWYSLIRNPHAPVCSHSLTLIVHRLVPHRSSSSNPLHLVQPEADYVVAKRDGDLCFVLGKEAVIRLNKGTEFYGYDVENLNIVNVCNGLVCLTSARKSYRLATWGPFFVWNPVSSDYVVVKQDRPSAKYGIFRLEEHCGFGFSDKSNQYKLVRFLSNREDYFDDWTLAAEVLTVGSDQGWRSIKEVPLENGNYIWSGRGRLFAGALHWIVFRKRTFVTTIVAFDCEEEKFALVSPPGDLSCGFEEISRMDLAILQLRLCFCVWMSQETVIWVMDDYGVKESWRKLFVISALGALDFLMPFKPLAYLKNGEILMLSVINELVSYDAKTNSRRVIKIPGVSEKVEAMLFDPIFLPTQNPLMQEEQPQ